MNELRIGWASRDVSTDKPINIPGQFHMRISRGVMDPVTVTALVIDNGADSVIFLSCDLVVIRCRLLDEVRAKVTKLNPAIAADKIVMNATHAHTGPSHYGDAGWGKVGSSTASPSQIPCDVEVASSDEYRDFLSTQAAEAIAEAYAKRAPGGVAYGYGYAVVSHSRRVVYFDDQAKRPNPPGGGGFNVAGHATMYGNTNDDQFSHYEAGADPFINLL